MNYNTLRNKPTINYRELIGDSTVAEVGGITEEEFNTLMNTDLASYYTKAQIDELFARSFVYREKSGSIVTFDCPTSTTSGITKVVSDIVAVQSGTGDPSPTNVRPITGWSAVNVTRSGKNLLDVNKIQKVKYNSAENERLGVSFEKQGTYTVSANIKQSGVYIYAKKITNGVYGDVSYIATPDNLNSATYTLTENDKLIVYTAIDNINLLETAKQYMLNTEIQIELNDTATTYEPYNGQTYTINLDGTRYGCTLDVVSGVLTVDRVNVDMGTINWIYSENAQVFGSNQFFPYVLTNGKLQSSQYKWNSTPNVSPMNLADGEMSASPYFNRQTVMVKDSRYSDATAFKTAMNGVQLVYELATPQTIQLTPTAVKSLLGTNNIWADTGDITVTALDKIIQG